MVQDLTERAAQGLTAARFMATAKINYDSDRSRGDLPTCQWASYVGASIAEYVT